MYGQRVSTGCGEKRMCYSKRQHTDRVLRLCYEIRLFLWERMGKICLCAVGADSVEISAGVKRSHLAVLWPSNPYSVQNQPFYCGSR